MPYDHPVNLSKASHKPYEEEESYENPVNISKAPGMQDDYIDIRSEYANAAAGNISIGINQSMDEAIVQISHLQIDENAQDSYQVGVHQGSLVKNRILDPKYLGQSTPEGSDSQNNTIKLVKDDIVIGGQANPNVKITRQGKCIRIG